MPRKLTDALVASLKPNGRDQFVFDSLLSGYLVRVTPAGAKLLQAKRGSRRITLGRFPELSAAVGRERCLLALVDMRRGADPMLEHKMRQAAAAAGDMITAALIDKWLADYVRPKLKPATVRDYEKLAAKHIKPALGHLPVKQVSRDDVVQLHLVMKRTPRRANYVVSITRTAFNFAEDLGLRPRGSNPAARIKRYRERKIERFLTEAEYARAAEGIAAAARAGKNGPYATAGLWLALKTGARCGEICSARWVHVHWDRKLIRLPDSKTNEPRTIHLSDAAIEVLRAIPRRGPYIIAGAIDGKPFQNLGRSWIIARKLAGLDDVRLHDLRHSYASLAASRGVSLLAIGKLLGHRLPQTTARYAHLARDSVAAINDELGAAMQAAIERGSARASASVVKLRPPRRR
jgi:integrase